MKLYLDDDSASGLLAPLLRQAGHDVRLPIEIGVSGESDAVHLTKAVQEGRVCLSQNYRDFEELHNLVMAVGGHHPGIFVVRKDNNPKRDFSEPGIVRAIAKSLAAQVPIADEYIMLNYWR